MLKHEEQTCYRTRAVERRGAPYGTRVLSSTGFRDAMTQTFTEGPFLKAALFCENAIEDKEGVLTLVRVIDRVVQQAIGPDAPAEMPAISNYPLTAVLMFVSGSARGSLEVGLSLESPSGMATNLGTSTILLEGEDRGANLVARMALNLDQQGLYWLDVFVDGQRFTRVPLRVVYARLSRGQPPR